jgi:uncharacterized PurR-regulated membrane protein YhhQ (DUF165 family)
MHSVLNFRIRKPNYGPRHLAFKNHAVAAIGEFVGTCLFLIFAFGGTKCVGRTFRLFRPSSC